MRFRRSALAPCPNCASKRKGLDLRVWPGGGRYLDQHKFECVICGFSGKYVFGLQAAMDDWNKIASPDSVPEEDL